MLHSFVNENQAAKKISYNDIVDIGGRVNRSGLKKWSFDGALFYAMTIMTTIGY